MNTSNESLRYLNLTALNILRNSRGIAASVLADNRFFGVIVVRVLSAYIESVNSTVKLILPVKRKRTKINDVPSAN